MALFHNLGNGKFEDVTKKAGLDPAWHAMGCTPGDYDNDGFADIVLGFKAIMLLHNEKDGTLQGCDQTAEIESDGPNTGLDFRRLRPRRRFGPFI